MGLFMRHKALQKGGERVKVGFSPPTKGAGAKIFGSFGSLVPARYMLRPSPLAFFSLARLRAPLFAPHWSYFFKARGGGWGAPHPHGPLPYIHPPLQGTWLLTNPSMNMIGHITLDTPWASFFVFSALGSTLGKIVGMRQIKRPTTTMTPHSSFRRVGLLRTMSILLKKRRKLLFVAVNCLSKKCFEFNHLGIETYCPVIGQYFQLRAL